MMRAIARFSLIFLTSYGAFGQPAAAPLAFEVASVKPNKSGERGSSTHYRDGEIVLRNVSLKQFIELVYEVKDYSLSGPDWLGSERFDIAAKFAPGTPREQVLRMAQALLAERFKLAVHRESKVLLAYALVAAKNGPKLREVEAGGSDTSTGRGQFTGRKVSMPQFADWLSRMMDRPVVDKTEIKGVFDIKLEWTPEESQPLGLGETGERRPPTDSPSGPSIFTALQEQLGLKLQGQKLPVEILVVDHAEKVPTENYNSRFSWVDHKSSC